MGFWKTRALIATESAMAIYHLHHSTVGKATQRQAHTAAAHVAYVSRRKACSVLLAERMPEESKEAQAWLCNEEDNDRKNGRVIDKVMLALPRELPPEERMHLVKEFAEDVTQGTAPWLAAIHDKQGNDKDNPHCHLVIRDRDPETGKRALHMSAGPKERAQLAKKGIEPVSTEKMRFLWAEHANRALERIGSSERIDHRTLESQGIAREPTIHEGVQARQMERRGERPASKVVEFPNSAMARSHSREVDYRQIDQGKTRSEHNAEIISLAEKRKERGQKPADERSVQIRRAVSQIEVYLQKQEVKKATRKKRNDARSKGLDKDQEWEP